MRGFYAHWEGKIALSAGGQLVIELMKHAMPYKNAGCVGPTLYRHNDGVNMAFYDAHVECRKKDKVCSQEAWDVGRAGMCSTFFKRHPPSQPQQDSLPVP